MDSTEKENKELAAAILAGEMKNSWQAEDRKGIPDSRPANLIKIPTRAKSRSYYENYDRIFRRMGYVDKGKEIEVGGEGAGGVEGAA